ncbi:MAG TPA: metallopeptidase family protein [Dehalococcoidia bacterium]|nr:metallopeptidase family protein [Dehalococcoidia bacterium]
MRRREFERIVLEALEDLPPRFREALENVDIQVRWRPTLGELRRAGVRRGTLFGVYLGIPLPKRSHGYSMTLPDTIVIYQQAHERYCRDENEMRAQARQTVLHEIGHYLGIDEDRLQELGVG